MSEVKTDSVVNVSGDSDSGIDLSTNDVVAIKTADSEVMRVDVDGKLLINTTSSDTSDFIQIETPASGGGQGIHLRRDDSNTDQRVGSIRFGNNTEATLGLFAVKTDGATNSGAMTFSTANAGSTAERIRIGKSGDIFFNQFTTTSPGQGNNTFGAVISDTGRVFSSANGTYALGLNRSDSGELTNFSRAGTFKGSISITASQVNYNQTSDHRLKENVSDMTGAITRLKTLQPKRFNFIADPDDTTVDGFLAHEVTAVPEAVTGTHNATDSDNNPIYQQIDQSKLVPLLVGALQEAIAKIETLETKVTALENA